MKIHRLLSEKMNHDMQYSLDHSAMIHLASAQKDYSNCFRISITLKESVDPEILQKAVNRITQRFPTVIAGIRREFFQYKIVHNRIPPKIQKEQKVLLTMGKEEIKKCAFRVLYAENEIAIEVFHALTDGCGGMVVISTLVAEYLQLRYQMQIPVSEFTKNVMEFPEKQDLSDDYMIYGKGKGQILQNQNSYQFSEKSKIMKGVWEETAVYPSELIHQTAHFYNTSVTVLLTAILEESIRELQRKSTFEKEQNQAIRIMIPVNLRKLFTSKTLRNFSLYAVISNAGKQKRSFEQRVQDIQIQLSRQANAEFMQNSIAMNVRMMNMRIYKCLPLCIKKKIIGFIHTHWGEKNSCISVSNLGMIVLPEPMQKYIEQMRFLLTPRISSGYNCSVVSLNGKMYISFSRTCEKQVLEQIFFDKLEQKVQEIRLK